jgi:diguanylate cyclase (GGDEF)-like protein
MSEVVPLRVLCVGPEGAADRLRSALARLPAADARRLRRVPDAERAAAALRDGAEVVLVATDAPLETVSALRAAGVVAPVVALCADDEAGVRLLAAGADEYLPEPAFSPHLLERTLRLAEGGLGADRDPLARPDRLTGLPSASFFERQLEHALHGAARHERRIAVGVLGLDDFPALASRLDRDGTESLLRAVADRLGSALRRSDLVARGADDHFLLLLESTPDLSDLAAMASKVLAAVAADRPVRVRGSLGLAVYPGPHRGGEALLAAAHGALARARAAGGDDFRLDETDAETVSRRRLALEDALPGALERDEFRLLYQPRVCAATGTVVGVEVLLRWHSPDFGAVDPSVFIPVAERIGCIERIDDWVLGAALADAGRWYAQGHRVRLGVNASAPQLRDAGLAGRIAGALRATGLPPELLELEMTERLLVDDDAPQRARFEALTALGIGLAVDDFGIGFSSLAYLKHFPVHTLKIDRMFVAPLPEARDDAAIVRAVIGLGHALGLRVVAEGVETDAQLAFLREAGCDEAQGWLVGRPCSADAFAERLTHAP